MVLATLLAARDWEETAGGHSEHQWLPVEGLQCVDTDRENWKFSSTCFIYEIKGFPCGSAGKEYACSERDQGSVPGLGRSPGEGNGYPLLYCGLENSMDCIVHGVAKSRTRLSDFHFNLKKKTKQKNNRDHSQTCTCSASPFTRDWKFPASLVPWFSVHILLHWFGRFFTNWAIRELIRVRKSRVNRTHGPGEGVPCRELLVQTVEEPLCWWHWGPQCKCLDPVDSCVFLPVTLHIVPLECVTWLTVPLLQIQYLPLHLQKSSIFPNK